MLNRLAPPTVQLIFTGIHNARWGSLALLQQKCKYQHVCAHACKPLETRDMVIFNRFGSITQCPKKGLGGNCMKFRRVQPDLARIDVPILQMQVVWLRVRTMWGRQPQLGVTGGSTASAQYKKIGFHTRRGWQGTSSPICRTAFRQEIIPLVFL